MNMQLNQLILFTDAASMMSNAMMSNAVSEHDQGIWTAKVTLFPQPQEPQASGRLLPSLICVMKRFEQETSQRLLPTAQPLFCWPGLN